MRTYILILGISIMLASCSKQEPCEGLSFNIENHTSLNFDRFEIGDLVIHDFDRGDEEKNICISDGIGYPDQPLVYFIAYKDGHEFLSSAYRLWCGTGMIEINEGHYDVEIHDPIDDTTYFAYTIEKK